MVISAVAFTGRPPVGSAAVAVTLTLRGTDFELTDIAKPPTLLLVLMSNRPISRPPSTWVESRLLRRHALLFGAYVNPCATKSNVDPPPLQPWPAPATRCV